MSNTILSVLLKLYKYKVSAIISGSLSATIQPEDDNYYEDASFDAGYVVSLEE